MSLILSVFGAILLLAILIFVHELGHFVMARRNGVRVDAFAVGFGPTLWSKTKGDTTYSLKLIPLGGYVKLFGEDATDSKMLKKKDSFISKTAWQRFQILIAGVTVNFIVGILLFSLAFWVKVPPLITSQSGLEAKLLNGEAIQVMSLLVNKGNEEIVSGSSLVAVNGEKIDVNSLEKYMEDNELAFEGELKFISPEGNEVLVNTEGKMSISDLGLKLYSPVILSRLQVLDSTDVFSKGDVLLSLNDEQLVGLGNLSGLELEEGNSTFEVLRDGEVVVVNTTYGNLQIDGGTPLSGVYVSDTSPDSAARLAGLIGEFFIEEVDGQVVNDAELTRLLLGEVGDEVGLKIRNLDGEVSTMLLAREPGALFGLFLGDVTRFANTDLEVASVPVLGSLVFTDLAYPSFFMAPVAAVQYSGEIAWLTVSGFSGVVVELVTSFSVPDEIGGPIAVTQIATQFIQTDAPALLWLVGIISVTLAIMNLLPIPALDGGRILFVIIEVVRGGKRVSQKIEAVVHMVGFLLLMGLIVVVSFQDVLRYF